MFSREDKKFLLAMAFMLIGVLGCINSISMMWHSKNFMSFYEKNQLLKKHALQLKKTQFCNPVRFTIYEQ